MIDSKLALAGGPISRAGFFFLSVQSCLPWWPNQSIRWGDKTGPIQCLLGFGTLPKHCEGWKKHYQLNFRDISSSIYASCLQDDTCSPIHSAAHLFIVWVRSCTYYVRIIFLSLSIWWRYQAKNYKQEFSWRICFGIL